MVAKKRRKQRHCIGRSTAMTLWVKQNGRCIYCDCMMTPQRNHPNSRTVEHLRPRARGGLLWDIFNLALACRRCNNEKGDLLAEEFIAFVLATGRYPNGRIRLAYARERGDAV
jgi:5-methylcytosine-specific restriction endonuclease McrA